MQHAWKIAGLSLPFGPKEALAVESAKVSTVILNGENKLPVHSSIAQSGQGRYRIQLANAGSFQPGTYTLEAKVKMGKEEYYSYQDFSWGVLVLNTQKSRYQPGETVNFGFGVLNDEGRTVCDAALTLSITIPSEQHNPFVLSTQNKLIKPSGKCSANSVSNNPDYIATFRAKGKQEVYQLHLAATTANGTKTIVDSLRIVKSDPFVIERSSFPSRIYPPAAYPVTVSVKPEEDFAGTVSDTVPAAFDITSCIDRPRSQSDATLTAMR